MKCGQELAFSHHVVMEIELKSSALAVAASALTSRAIWSKMYVLECIIRTSEVTQ